MKRVQLIEWGVVTVGLVFGFKFFEGLFAIFAQLLFEIDRTGPGSGLIKLIILYAAYAVSFILLIRKSSEIATWINGPSKNDTIAVSINKHSLLQIVLIALCIATILSRIAQILLYLFETFKHNAGSYHEPANFSVSRYTFDMAAIESIVAFVVMYFSKEISGWFIRKNEAEELTFESETENKD